MEASDLTIKRTTHKNLVLRDGLEPPSPDYKTGILAFEITEQILKHTILARQGGIALYVFNVF